MCLGCVSVCMFLFRFIYLSFSISVSLSLSHNRMLRECSDKSQRKTKTMEKKEQDHNQKKETEIKRFVVIASAEHFRRTLSSTRDSHIWRRATHMDESCHTYEVVVHRWR